MDGDGDAWFDLNPRLVDQIQDVVDEHLPDGNLHLYNDDGVRHAATGRMRKNPLMPSLLTPIT